MGAGGRDAAAAVSAPPRSLLPALALTFNAFVWGVSWWPLRQLHGQGLHPLWTTVCVFALAAAVIALARPRALGEVVRTPALWVLVLAAGSTNAAFNWAVSIGEVVRVVLLFYLMPVWAVLLARLLLKEPIRGDVLLRVGLALGGALVVLWPAPADGATALPLPRSLADWLGLAGGFAFALNNVMLKREAHRSEEGRAMAMFAGGVVVAGTLALLLSVQARIAWPPALPGGGLLLLLAMAGAFLLSNLALQYGSARLAAHATAVLMLSEVLFAAVSAVVLGNEALTLPLLAGGALILGAAALATLAPRDTAPPGLRSPG